MPNPADLLARATPEMLEQWAEIAEAEVPHFQVQSDGDALACLATLARAVPVGEGRWVCVDCRAPLPEGAGNICAKCAHAHAAAPQYWREVTEAMVEAGARALHDGLESGVAWDGLFPSMQDVNRDASRRVLAAALSAQGKERTP